MVLRRVQFPPTLLIFNTMRTFNIKYNVGKVKYLVSYHNGTKQHKDGSKFFDIKTFSNKTKLNLFVKSLIKQGYKQ